jgi:hypothetical protein
LLINTFHPSTSSCTLFKLKWILSGGQLIYSYWLPHYQRHPYVALSFVSQAEYEKAAPLDILPGPDVVTRVFMLFQKVDESDLAQWVKASERAKDSVSFWRTVVGVKDKEAQEDKKVFRVLEWGGMEIV